MGAAALTLQQPSLEQALSIMIRANPATDASPEPAFPIPTIVHPCVEELVEGRMEGGVSTPTVRGRLTGLGFPAAALRLACHRVRVRLPLRCGVAIGRALTA